MERIEFVINLIRGNIKKMIRDDVISILFRNIIHHIFPYNKEYSSNYLFNLLFTVFSFKYIFSLKYYPQVFPLVFIDSASKQFIPLLVSQIFHSFQRGKQPQLTVSLPFLKVLLVNTSLHSHHTPSPFFCCLQGISVLEDFFCFNKLA